MTQFLQATQGRADPIVKYCCVLQTDLEGAVVNGDGFIVEFQGLQEAELLALNWRNCRKTGELQTDYALITSHDTMPGLSPSALKDWTFSCQGIESGKKQQLSNFVCGVISCCGSETLFAGHSPNAKVFVAHHGNTNCDIQLNIAILFLSKSFEELLQRSTGNVRTLLPPVVPVGTYLDQTLEYEQIITRGELDVYSCNAGMRTVKTTLAKQQDTSGQNTASVLNKEIVEFERLQKLEISSTMETGHGSPVVYLKPDCDEPAILIGVYVGKTKRKERDRFVVTFRGILRLLQGGLVPVLSVLHCLDIPHAWASRWRYLVTPCLDQMRKMECSYVCEVLHFLLRERHGTPLVKLTVDLVDLDSEASLDLLCALFKHFESADSADLNDAVTKLNLKNEMNAYITRLCKDVIHLLEFGYIMVTGRTTLVEKCLIFYSRLLNFKFAGITEKILRTPQSLELLKRIQQGFKHSDVVQKNVVAIILKRHPLSSKELLALKDDILPEDVIDGLQQIGLDLKTTGDTQTTIEEVQSQLHLLEQHETASNLRQLLDLALENQSHYEAYQKALQEGKKILLKYLKVLFFGPPRTGKTSMRRRLVGEIQNLSKEPAQASTGTAEVHDVIVKLFEDKLSSLTTVITKSKWSSIKALFGKEKGSYATDLDDELRLLYRFTYEADSLTEKKSPVSKPFIEEKSQGKASKEQSSAILQKDIATDTALVPQTIDRGTSTLQEVSSVEEPINGLSAEEKKHIEKAFEAFNKILHTGGQEQLKVLLDGTILMNMIDTGGQPAFLEMLPALTMGPALYLIFFRLNQELKDRYQIQYVSKDREEISLGDSSYTVEEVIFQALSSIACFSCTAPKKANMPDASHAAVLIATHKDLLGSDPQAKIKAKDDALQENLREILETDLESDRNFLHYASKDQLMFAIDNMTGDERELTNVRKRLEDIINQEFGNFPIPASWLMFSIFLRKMGKRTLSLSQCREIGAKLKVRDTDEALWFLHHCVGILMHFPDVEEIKDIVICDPQVVFDSVTDLILNSFKLKRVKKLACDRFNEAGQFKFKDIQKIAENFKSDSLSLPKLVKLLEYLNIIAPIKPECPSFSALSPSSSIQLSPRVSPQSDTYQEEKLLYFMPAVLKHATEEELYVEQSPTDPIPLMIHFKCGFVPVGVFCAMIASLVARKDTHGWILLEPFKYHCNQGGHILRKNKVTFRINGAYDVTLISKLKRYEIHIACFSTADKAALEDICQHVLETVCNVLDQVICKMKYKQYLISPYDQTLYQLGFKCPRHPEDDHLVINRPKKGGVEAPSHSAKLVWLNFFKGKSTMICLEEERCVDFAERSLSPSFAEQSLIWFGKATKISSASPQQEGVKGELSERKRKRADSESESSLLVPTLKRNHHGAEESTANESQVELSKRPNLPNLLSFPGKVNINIPRQIGTKYPMFGILLLNDETGAEINTIALKYGEDAELINLEILRRWIEGRGKPLSWDTLIDILLRIGLHTLASDIKDALHW